MFKFFVVKVSLICTLTLSADIRNSADNTIETYFNNFKILVKSEDWKEILSQGSIALEIAKKLDRKQEEALICAELTSTAFYLGEYPKALEYAQRCHELSASFKDISLFIRALYLESAIYRALSSKAITQQTQQTYYLLAVTTAEKAASLYSEKNLDEMNLKGKVYFNLGAAHADNPKGDLTKAQICYFTALECFKSIPSTDDIIRTSMRLGKVYLLKQNYEDTQKILDDMRPLISNNRLAMQADYLEAQLNLALNDLENAKLFALSGLNKAKTLNAKEDLLRLETLLEKITHFTNVSNHNLVEFSSHQ